MRPSDWYQIALIFLGIIGIVFFGVFVSREIFPEYKIYQEDYIALEEFRSTYTHEPPPEFKMGVKQILIEKENHPPIIDRCISCHVALQFPHFSPTKIARDINGNIIRDEQGNPIQIPNEEYVWGHLDKKIKELVDPVKLEQLRNEGKSQQAAKNLQEAKNLESLKEVRVGDRTYDVTKVLSMHPLIGKETRPFEFHSISDYGCVACHNGNGRGLTTEKAHGPVFDEQYDIEFEGPVPKFLEEDPENDPKFAHVFNNKPGPSMLFQTMPLYPGALIQAKCMECHQSSAELIESSLSGTQLASQNAAKRANSIKEAYQNEGLLLLSLISLQSDINSKGLSGALKELEKESQNYNLPPQEHDQILNQIKWLKKETNGNSGKDSEKRILEKISKMILDMVGSSSLVKQLEEKLQAAEARKESPGYVLEQFIHGHLNDNKGKGTLFIKAAAWDLEEKLAQHIKDTESSFKQTVGDQTFVTAVHSDVDILTADYQKGRHLFFSQACYACHRINGLTRGGVGPELTKIGESYPWYVKESIVWPQADVPSSTMPNERLDHEELEKVVTYLLGQTGRKKTASDVGYKIAIQEWEAGKKAPWEKPITPAQMMDLRYNMTVFATEGCAACHRLKGFESNVGFSIEKHKPDFDALFKEREWFSQLFPEQILGSEIVKQIDAHKDEIDKRIADNVRKNSILEEIDEKFPGDIEALYAPFKFANRAKNSYYQNLIANESDPESIQKLKKEHTEWQDRVKRILMVYIQEYGLGRLICPRPNWSGVYHKDEWLMEHFRNPSYHVPQSIMPVFPFDDTKFYGLTHMLDVLGRQNRDAIKEVWKHRGFSPKLAYDTFCAQCHGDTLIGNGPVSQWIYPIPKNLLNSSFLRNLTKERVINSIMHGVKGTPMPPWGEIGKDKSGADNTPVLSKEEIDLLANWIFSMLPGEQVIKNSKDVPKWQYTPSDVIEELKNEGNKFQSAPSEEEIAPEGAESLLLKRFDNYYASLEFPTSPSPNIEPETEDIIGHDKNLSQEQLNVPADVSEIFDVEKNPQTGTDKYLYFIKKKYFTKFNVNQGRQFFDMNCAVCHGKEADGAGIRAEVMQDAKPRMLINIDWLNTRDDLRILRSIKYGVPGTAMTPWGDLTSSLQRLQLAVFIRSLTEQQKKQDDLSSVLFKAFDNAIFISENARSNEYKKLAKLEIEYNSIRNQRVTSYQKIEQGKESEDQGSDIYKKELELLKKVNAQKEIDHLYANLKDLIKQEEDQYRMIGQSLIVKIANDDTFANFLKLIELNIKRYEPDGSKLKINKDSEKEEKELSDNIISSINDKIKKLVEEKVLEEGKISSTERSKKLEEIDTDIKGLSKLKDDTISKLSEAKRYKQKQKEIIEKLNKANKDG